MRRLYPLSLIVLMFFCAGLVPAPPVRDTVRCQVWHNLPGAQVTDTLTMSQLQGPADESRMVQNMQWTPGCQDGTVIMLTALVTPPRSGAYWFHIASTDSGLLFFSPDENPANRRAICETPAATKIHDYRYYSAQTSDGVLLQAGHRYFLQAIAKSAGDNGCLSIAWTMPGGKKEWPIPSWRFSPAPQVPAAPSLAVKHFSLELSPTTRPTTQPGIQRLVYGAQMNVDGRSTDLSYMLYLPMNYNTTTQPVPMMVFLHGNNMQGYDLAANERVGTIRDLKRDPALQSWFPMIVLSPQLPPDWRWDTPGAASAVNALVDRLCESNLRIDRHRIYLTGYSMGGKGTWLVLENSPRTYAAVAPISAVDVRPDLAPQWLKDLPDLHIACGSEDGGFTAGSHRMYEALKPVLGDRVQLTVFPHEGHSVWEHFYSNRAFYEELMKYSR